MGKTVAQIDQREVSHLSTELNLIIRKTNLNIPFYYQTDIYKNVSSVLVFDTARNQMIYKDIQQFVDKGKSILILSERKAHLQVLNPYLKEKFETIVISGEDFQRSRKSKLE